MDASISFPWLVVPHLITEKEMWFRSVRNVPSTQKARLRGRGSAQTWQSDRENGWKWMNIIFKSHDGSMVLVYMLTWMGYIDGIHVTIYSSTMDPMGMDEEFSVSDFKLKWMKLDEFRPIWHGFSDDCRLPDAIETSRKTFIFQPEQVCNLTSNSWPAGNLFPEWMIIMNQL